MRDQYSLQLADEVIVGGQPVNTKGWLINIRGAQCKVFTGDGYLKHVDMSRIQLRSRSRPNCVAWILEGIARILAAQNIVDEPIPRCDLNSVPTVLQKLIQELSRSCAYTSFKNYVLTCGYVDEQQDYNNNLERQIEELKLAVGQLTRLKIKQSKQISELEDRRDILDQLVADLTATNSQLQLEKDKINLEKSEYSAKLFQISNQHDDLAEISAETIRKLESDRNRMLNKIEQLTKACQQSNIELEDLEMKHQKIQFEYASIKSIRDGLVAENFQLKGSVTNLTRECERFQSRNKTVVHEKNELQQRLDSLKTKYIHLDEDFTSLKLKSEGLERNVAKFTAILKEKNDILSKMSIDGEEQRLKIDSRDSRIQEMMKYNVKQSEDIAELKQQYNVLQDEYRAFREDMEPKYQGLQAHCRNLEDELDETQARVKTLVNDNVSGVKRIEDLLGSKHELTKRVGDQSYHLNDLQENIAKVEGALEMQKWQNRLRATCVDDFLNNNMALEDRCREWEERIRTVMQSVSVS